MLLLFIWRIHVAAVGTSQSNRVAAEEEHRDCSLSDGKEQSAVWEGRIPKKSCLSLNIIVCSDWFFKANWKWGGGEKN